MANEVDENDEVKSKKIKLCDDSCPNSIAEDLSAHARLNSFKDFKIRQILNDNSATKTIFFEGTFESSEESAVVIVEKLPIDNDKVESIVKNIDFSKCLETKSDSTKCYKSYPTVNRGDIKATIVYPATSLHKNKYIFHPYHIVEETPEIYKGIVLPYIESQKFSNQWIYNILEHKKETEKIVFEDPDPETGFVLLPDLKWDGTRADLMYLIAICHTRNIKSLRDLTLAHLPLLKNIKTKCLDVILEKYNIPSHKLRIYFHYQPSYYHLHIHFNCIQNSVYGTNIEKAHLLDTVISNIELLNSYYQDATLTYTLKENDALFEKLKSAGFIST